ncbi:MAG: hypothetical protein HN509_17800 [Halobacteriovoraceae bacterium]|jgi:23S rRNA G2445 N2-methylase RlmL|nr:hypothetical protein [Halobacteriovoraceae bacterium]MBT5095140.1 hypothetical protein [Halobacteriovoraceae bacterium]
MNQTMNEKEPTYFVSCPSGVEKLLVDELASFGLNDLKQEKGGVSLQTADEKEIISVVLNSRLASRVFKILQSYTIYDKDDLYRMASQKWWHKEFDVDQTFKIQTLFDFKAKKILKNSNVYGLTLKDAICDQFRKECNKRPDVAKEDPDISLTLRIEDKYPNRKKNEDAPEKNNFMAIISIDLCGTPLNFRGYRSAYHQAPLRENLAAALIMASDWKPNEEILFDGMCGSATILIEAALIAGGVSPSYLRVFEAIENNQQVFAFEEQSWFVDNNQLKNWFYDHIDQECKNNKNKLKNIEPGLIFGSDISPGFLKSARANLKEARIPKEAVRVDLGDATKDGPGANQKSGVYICNPPYGERLVQEDIEKLYYDLGENLKNNWKGFRAYVFTSDPSLRKKIALQTSERIPFFNGKLECRLLKYDLY